jgi:ankyrin repeat protein
LEAAASKGRAETCRVRINAGAGVNIHGGLYGSALQAAAARSSYSDVKMLLDARADLNVQGGRYGSALRAARSRDHEDIVELLLNAEAKDDTDVTNGSDPGNQTKTLGA